MENSLPLSMGFWIHSNSHLVFYMRGLESSPVCLETTLFDRETLLDCKSLPLQSLHCACRPVWKCHTSLYGSNQLLSRSVLLVCSRCQLLTKYTVIVSKKQQEQKRSHKAGCLLQLIEKVRFQVKTHKDELASHKYKGFLEK